MKKLYRQKTESIEGVATKVLDPIIPVDRNAIDNAGEKPFGYDSTKDALVPRDNIALDTVNVAEELRVRGLTYLDDDVHVGAGLTIKGDLIVDGTTYTTNEESIDTSSDYVILRHNNPSGLSGTEKSGIVVHNYVAGKSAAIGVDNKGVWRVSDNESENITEYSNISSYKGIRYEGLTQDTEVDIVHGAAVSQDADELSEVVWYDGKYYKWDNVKWFEVSLVDNQLYMDIADPITDEDLITELEALEKADLFYIRKWSILTISDEENEPLLTRAEEEDLNPNGILAWDANKSRAVTIDNPVTNNTVLTAQITPGTTEEFNAYVIDDVYYDSDLSQVTIPDGFEFSEEVQIGEVYSYNDTFYVKDDNYYEVSAFTESEIVKGDEITDSDVIDALDSLEPIDVFYATYTNTTETTIDYQWKSGGSGSVSVFNTPEEYQEALSKQEGEDGYIPNNGLVVLNYETEYVTADVQ